MDGSATAFIPLQDKGIYEALCECNELENIISRLGVCHFQSLFLLVCILKNHTFIYSIYLLYGCVNTHIYTT